VEASFTEESITRTNESIAAMLPIFCFSLQEIKCYIDAHPPVVCVLTPRLFSLHPDPSYNWACSPVHHVVMSEATAPRNLIISLNISVLRDFKSESKFFIRAL
jgi:hypothetical protein